MNLPQRCSMAPPLPLLLCLLCALTQSTRAEPPAQCNDNENGQCDNSAESSYVCGLYLAQSSIPNSGLGILTGVPHEVGAVIAPPEIAHQLLVGFDGSEPQLHASSEYDESLIRQYVWSSFVSGGSFEASMVESLIPGIGMAANSFLPLVNSRSIMGSIDSAGVIGRNHGPGAGAFSAYHGVTYVAEMALEAGSEIFADYGDAYFRDRPDVYGMIPLEQEFEWADEIMKGLWEALPDKDAPIGDEWQPLWNTIRNLVEDERTRNALPRPVSEIQRAATKGTPYNFLRGDNPRSLEWLQSNGLCIDTLDVKPSDIAQAGRGGFAKRSFAAGEVILPMPMMQISREALRIYKGQEEDQDSEVHSHQQLLNYCFGQKDSSMVLFPYSSTSSFVNHGGKEANAKIVWSSEETDVTGFHRDEWMKRRPNELVEEEHTGLMLMMVATRNIVAGEEVTIDYGPEWEAAWENHLAVWSKNHGPSETLTSTSRLTASELNEFEDRIRTVFEESYDSVGTACHYRYDPSEDKEQMAINVEPGQEVDGHEALGLVYDEPAPEQLRSDLAYIEERATVWRDHGGRATLSGDNFRPCKVISRKEGSSLNEDRYTVRVFNTQNGAGHSDQIPTNKEHYVKEVPRRAILFVDLPYTSSQQEESTFRHEIGFPDADGIWPEVWKDLVQ